MTLVEIIQDIADSGTLEVRISVPYLDGTVATVRVIVARIVKPDGTVAFDNLPDEGRDVGKPLH